MLSDCLVLQGQPFFCQCPFAEQEKIFYVPQISERAFPILYRIASFPAVWFPWEWAAVQALPQQILPEEVFQKLLPDFPIPAKAEGLRVLFRELLPFLLRK